MAGEADEVLGQLALERGLVAAQQIREALRALSRTPEKRLSEVLVELGFLASGAAAALEEEARNAGASTFIEGRDALYACPSCGKSYRIHAPQPGQSYRCKGCSGVLQETPRPTPAGIHRNFGRYTIESELGRGGMGVVYKARDPGRERPVAIKVMLGSDKEEEVKRFLREASTASALDHPNIVHVYEVDEVDGTPFIAMEFVEGPSFARLLKPRKKDPKRIPLRRAIEIVRDVARALDYAHGRGIVHRDIKPENIMLDAQDRVRVMDFGLAREIARGATVTASGAVIGTPVYMSPEQASGRKDAIDGRSDLWALGIMLYEAATERTPFLGETPAEILHRVLHEEPVPPRRHSAAVDRDLETIVMKCLEWESHRRYATAGDLADDLDRYLDRRPIRAKPASLVYKLRRRLGKRKGIVIAAAAGIAALAILSAVLIPKLGRAREEARAEKERTLEARKAALDQLRQTTETALTAALGFRQMGRIADMEKFLRQTEEACRKASAEFPEEAEPHYRLGRMYRARMDDAKALEEQNRAIAKDSSFAPARYERVLLHGKLYRERLWQFVQEAQWAEGKRVSLGGSPRELPNPAELVRGDSRAQDLRRKIEEDLRAIAGARLPPAQESCAKGLLAWIDGSVEEARVRLAESLSLDPSMEEACEALATIEGESGRFEEAMRWWDRGCDHDRGYVPYFLGRGLTRNRWSVARNSLALCEEAIADFTAAIQLAPGLASPRLKRGIQRGNAAAWRLMNGERPVAAYEAAIADLSDAIARDPSCAEAYFVRGFNRFNLAEIAGAEGVGVDDLLRHAEADCGDALRLDPKSATAWSLRAQIHGMRALRAEPDFPAEMNAAISCLGEAIAIDPTAAGFWSTRAILRGSLARWTHERRGPDWEKLFQDAHSDFRQALRITPEDWEIALFAAQVGWRWSIALWNSRQKLDPLPGVIADYTRVVELRPSLARAWGDRGTAIYTYANLRRKLDASTDIREEIRNALRDLEKAFSLDSSLRSSYGKTADDCRAYLKE